MTTTEEGEEIYTSANGDTWRLISDASGRPVVRHKANQAAGGTVTEIGAHEFLQHAGSGPEFAALRRLIGKP
jgi:hypothetical protein